MRVVRVDPEHPDNRDIAEAAALIRAGRLVAFPTETVYGLGSNALDPKAIDRIFAAKGRPDYNPLIAHCADAAGAQALAAEWTAQADAIARAFWPGPLTLVVPKRSHIPDRLTAGLPTVAVRVPRHPVAQALLVAAGVPIAGPSANRFTELSPTTAAHVVKGLAGSVDLVLDSGPTQLGIESTVIDLSGQEPVLLRPGTIDRSALELVLGRHLATPLEIEGSTPRTGPGMMERHYSPRAKLLLVEGDPSSGIGRLASEAKAGGTRIGALLMMASPPAGIDEPINMPHDPESYARELYASLHRLDDAGCDLILVEDPPDDTRWSGVRDRLRRASDPA